MAKPTTIPNIPAARIDRILQATARALRYGLGCIGVDYKMRSDHSSLIDSKGRLLFDAHLNYVPEFGPFEKGNLTRCLQYADPATLHELARGYRLALDADLIKDHAEIDNG